MKRNIFVLNLVAMKPINEFLSDWKRWLNALILLLAIAFVAMRALHSGYDANVYLYAAQQLLDGENIYANNPYNFYLYSPLFATLLSPLTILGFDFARVVFALLNLAAAIRLWKIFDKLMAESLILKAPYRLIWNLSILFIATGFILHNLNLGQINILILWMLVEGLFQVMKKKKTILGAIILALGVNIKILPIFALYYLFFKRKFVATSYSTLFVVVSLFLPALFFGWTYNSEMLMEWGKTINPSKSKYVFENNNGTQSLNAILPAYFYDFESIDNPGNYPRQIASVPHRTLKWILQSIRILLLASLLYLLYYGQKNKTQSSLQFLWEIAYLSLIIVLVFPHQQKYAMLFFVPTGAYVLLLFLYSLQQKSTLSAGKKTLFGLSLLLMLTIALMGRDILGDHMVNVSDFYHFPGLNNLFHIPILLLLKPPKPMETN